MTKSSSISQLVATKKRLGPIVFLEFEALDIVAAHRKLGEDVKWQARKILSRKLDKLGPDQLIEQIRLLRNCRTILTEKSRFTRIDPRLRNAVEEYLDCLLAWSDGIHLNNFRHHLLQGLTVDGEPVSAFDLALLLQNDNSGCQTGVYRERNGSIILWHTEEDVEDEPGSRFDKLRVLSYAVKKNEGKKIINAFVYPDLLPGPAYCWRNDNFVQAVDSLYLKPNITNGGLLANTATWITLRLGKEIDPQEVIETLAPFIDGYALTIVQEKNGEVVGRKMEFAGNQMLTTSLESQPGSFFFQVNIFSKKEEVMTISYEDIDPNERRSFEKRITRTEQAIKLIKDSSSALPQLFNLLSSRSGGDYAYANVDVKSYFINKISSEAMEIWIGAGPVLKKGDKPKIITVKS